MRYTNTNHNPKIYHVTAEILHFTGVNKYHWKTTMLLQNNSIYWIICSRVYLHISTLSKSVSASCSFWRMKSVKSLTCSEWIHALGFRFSFFSRGCCFILFFKVKTLSSMVLCAVQQLSALNRGLKKWFMKRFVLFAVEGNTQGNVLFPRVHTGNAH